MTFDGHDSVIAKVMTTTNRRRPPIRGFRIRRPTREATARAPPVSTPRYVFRFQLAPTLESFLKSFFVVVDNANNARSL